MKVKRLIELLERMDKDAEVFIRNSVNPCGNIQELDQVESSSYGSFGEDIKCIILNTNSSKDIEIDEKDDIVDFVEFEWTGNSTKSAIMDVI